MYVPIGWKGREKGIAQYLLSFHESSEIYVPDGWKDYGRLKKLCLQRKNSFSDA